MTAEYAYGLPLDQLWFGLVFAILGTFLVLDGFDFGVGAIFALRRDHDEREALLDTVGPFWHANEVWLVVFGGALFAAFPPVYARLFSRHYLLMFAVLLALAARGLGPELRHQRDDAAWQRWWGRSFAAGSIAVPLLLGLFLGNWLVGATTTLTLVGALTGLTALALCVLLGAAFIRLKLGDPLYSAARTYGQAAALSYLVLVVATLVAIWTRYPALQNDLASLLPLGLVALTVLVLVGFLGALRVGWHVATFALGAVLTYGLVALVAVVMHPQVDPGSGLTLAEGIISPLPLAIMSGASALLLPLVALYFVILYSEFRGPVHD